MGHRHSIEVMTDTSHMTPLLERNVAFAATDAKASVPAIPFHPNAGILVLTCMDPRVDPAHVLGLALGDAVVVRNAGGRVTRAALLDVAYVSHLVETKTPQGPWLEVAVLHHTDCGSGFLADEDFRAEFARKVGVDESTLSDTPVLDPALTVKLDVEKLHDSGLLSSQIRVSGHVYDVATGQVTTV